MYIIRFSTLPPIVRFYSLAPFTTSAVHFVTCGSASFKFSTFSEVGVLFPFRSTRLFYMVRIIDLFVPPTKRRVYGGIYTYDGWYAEQADHTQGAQVNNRVALTETVKGGGKMMESKKKSRWDAARPLPSPQPHHRANR